MQKHELLWNSSGLFSWLHEEPVMTETFSPLSPTKPMNHQVVSTDLQRKHFSSNRKREKEKFDFWVNSTYIALLSIISCLLLYYVWILNANATQGYNIRQLELERKNLMMEKERYDAQIAELQSLSNIMTEEDLGIMQKVDEPEFVIVKDDVQYVYAGN